MTLSTTFRSFVRGRELRQPDHPAIRRLIGYRNACAPAEVSFPAAALGDADVARWLRDHRLAIDVRCAQELYSAISAGIHPLLMTVHADRFDADIHRAWALGVGRVVLSRTEHIAPLGADVAGRARNVLLAMTDAPVGRQGLGHFHFDSPDTDAAIAAVMGHRSLALIGLQCEVGTAADDFVSYPAAVGTMIAQMDHIRRRHGVVLTRLVLGLGGALSNADSFAAHRDLAEEIDGSVDDACATVRFPRPVVVLAAGAEIIGQRAA